MATLFHSIRKHWAGLLLLLFSLMILIPYIIGALANNFIVYPYEKESRWVCKKPYFVLEYHYENGGQLKQNTSLEINDELQPVDVCYQGGSFAVYPHDVTLFGERLLLGSWKYRGEQLVFHIEDDFAFDEVYKEIVFNREE